jgi:hypothetical protein
MAGGPTAILVSGCSQSWQEKLNFTPNYRGVRDMTNVTHSDLLSRLDVIKERAEKIRRKHKCERVPSDNDEDAAVLAYCVDYLASILRKHLETGER